jgi:hypothetical protein
VSCSFNRSSQRRADRAARNLAALTPFVGPYFNYSLDVSSGWLYTTDRLLLNVLPGVIAPLALVMLSAAKTGATGVLAEYGPFASRPPLRAEASVGEPERKPAMPADPQSAEALTLS